MSQDWPRERCSEIREFSRRTSQHLLESEPVIPGLESGTVAPSAAVEARVQRLAHATLLANRSAPNIGRLEFALCAGLIGGYAVYAGAQIFQIFCRVLSDFSV